MPKWMRILLSVCAVLITIFTMGMACLMIDKLYLSEPQRTVITRYEPYQVAENTNNTSDSVAIVEPTDKSH